MHLHSHNSPKTTLITLLTILTLNQVVLASATPQPSRNNFLVEARHPDPNSSNPQPKPTPPTELNKIQQHAKEPTTVSTITTITASPSGTPAISAPSFLEPKLFTAALLNSTNFYRSQHNASSVVYNSTLASFASAYLEKLGLPENPPSSSSSSSSSASKSGSKSTPENKCELVHSHGPYGENLALGCSDVSSCVEMWGNERDKYDFSAAKVGEDTGHFTQLVWKNTTDVGCAVRWCQGWNKGNGGWYLVCEYWPRGNVVGSFGSMVDRKISAAREELLAPGRLKMGVLVAVVGAWLVFG
ncbi:CAP domain-containing protein [Copromyces sp. CBS 386.78]|nr:CAP domain-containing protein [Copromyces sp. CBS 386.78]